MRRAYTGSRLIVSLLVVAAMVAFAPGGGPAIAGSAPGWTIVPSPNEAGAGDNRLMDVAGVSDQLAWAVGYVGEDTSLSQPLIEKWDGAAWGVFPISIPGLRDKSGLFGVDALPSGVTWAVGQNGRQKTLILRWEGSGWRIVPSPSVPKVPNRLLAVSARSARDVWAVGKAGRGVLIEHWNGKAWSFVSHPPLRHPSVLTSVIAPTSGPVWAVGAEGRPGGWFGDALTLRWTGTRWIRRPVTLPKGPADPAEASKFEGVTVGPDGPWAAGWYAPDVGISGVTLTYWWAEGAWHHVDSPNRGDTDSTMANGLRTDSSSPMWAVGVSGPYTWTMRWTGSEWRYVESPNVLLPEDGSNILRKVDCSGGIVWAVGYSNSRTWGADQTLIMQYQT